MFAAIDKNTNRVIDAVLAENAEEITEEFPTVYGVEMTLKNSPAGIGFIYNGEKFLMPLEERGK